MMYFYQYTPDNEGHVRLAGVDLTGESPTHVVRSMAGANVRHWSLVTTHDAVPWSCSDAAWQELLGYISLVIWGITVVHEKNLNDENRVSDHISMTTFPGGASISMLAAARYNARMTAHQPRELQHLFGVDTASEAPYLLSPELCTHLAHEMGLLAPKFTQEADLWGVKTGPRMRELFGKVKHAIEYAARNGHTLVIEPCASSG